MPVGESQEVIEALAAGEVGPSPASSEPLILLTNFDEVLTATLKAAQSAKRVLSIYTSQLEPQLYEHNAFLDVLKSFLLARSYSRVRVLMQEPLNQAGNGSKLLAMSRRLTTFMELRPASPAVRSRNCGMLIADDKAIVYRPQVGNWEGVAGFNQTTVARLHLSEFDQMWMASLPTREEDDVAVAS
jgi:hypothetical protein